MSRPVLLLIGLAVNAGLLVLYLRAPQWRGPLFAEDGILETVTALLFLLAFVVAIAALIRRQVDGYRTVLSIGAGLGLIGFLDEISFGARLFGWSMPAMRGGGEFDGAHDLVVLTYHFGSDAGLVAVTATLLLIGMAAVWAARRWRRSLITLLGRVSGNPVYGVFGLFLMLLGLASVADLPITSYSHIGAIEETLELNAGSALLLAMLLTRRSPRIPPEERSPAPAGSAPGPGVSSSAI